MCMSTGNIGNFLPCTRVTTNGLRVAAFLGGCGVVSTSVPWRQGSHQTLIADPPATRSSARKAPFVRDSIIFLVSILSLLICSFQALEIIILSTTVHSRRPWLLHSGAMNTQPGLLGEGRVGFLEATGHNRTVCHAASVCSHLTDSAVGSSRNQWPASPCLKPEQNPPHPRFPLWAHRSSGMWTPGWDSSTTWGLGGAFSAMESQPKSTKMRDMGY